MDYKMAIKDTRKEFFIAGEKRGLEIGQLMCAILHVAANPVEGKIACTLSLNVVTSFKVKGDGLYRLKVS